LSDTVQPTRAKGSPWRQLATGALSLLVFVIALGSGVVLHLDTPALRETTTELSNRATSGLLYGQIRIGAVTDLSARGVEVDHAELLDELGNMVLRVENVRIRADVLSVLYDVLLGGPTLNVVTQHVRVEHSMVRLVPNASSTEPTLSRALTPKPRERKEQTTGTSRYVRVWLPTVELGLVTGELGLAGWEGVASQLSRVRGSVLFSPKGIALDVDRFGTKIEGVFGTRLRGTGSLVLRAPGPLQVDFSGYADEAEVQAHARLERGELSLAVSAPLLTPRVLTQWFGQWPLLEPVGLRIDAAGRLPHLDAEARLDGAGGAVTLDGPVDLSDGVSGQFDVELEAIELARLIDGAPRGTLSAISQAAVEVRGSQYNVKVEGSTSEMVVGDVPVPKTRFELELLPGTVKGDLELLEPGGTIHAKGSFIDGRVDAAVDIPKVALRGHRRLPSGLSGITSLRGQLSLDRTHLTADATGSARDFGIGNVHADKINFKAKGSAKLSALREIRVEGEVDASQLTVGELSIDHAKITGSGSRHGASLEVELSDTDGRRLAARGQLHPDLSVTDGAVSLQRGAVSVKGKVRRFDWNRRIFDFPELEIRGEQGELTGGIHLEPGIAEGHLNARELDLARIASRFGIDGVPIAGSLNVEADVSIGQDVQRGDLRVSAKKLSIEHWGRGDLSLNARLKDHEFSGQLSGRDEVGFVVEGKWNAELAAHPLKLAAYQHMTGTAEVSVLGVPLGPLVLLLPQEVVKSIDGQVGVRALFQRTDPNGHPSALVELGSTVHEAVIESSKQPRKLRHLSSYVSVAFDSTQNKLNGVATLTDEHGHLLSATAGLELNPSAWLENASAAFEEFRRSPLSIVINAPARPLALLPLLNLETLEGTGELQVAVYGTAADPRFSVLVNGRNIVAPGLRRAAPVALTLEGQYAPVSGDVTAQFSGSSLGRSLLLGKVEGQAPLGTRASGTNWSGRARLALDRVPLSLFAALGDGEIDGAVSGQLQLSQGEHPALTADLDLAQLSSGRAVLGNATLRIKGERGRLLANFALDDSRRSLVMRLNAGAPTDGVPMPNQVETVDVAVTARSFDAGALAPMLDSIVARLGGDLNADLTLFARRVASTEPGVPAQWTNTLEGKASLLRGSGYIEGLGLELRDVSLVLDAESRSDATVLSLRDLRAKARSEKTNLEGQGEILLENNVITSATAALRLRSVPLTLEGLNLGRAQGQALASFERRSGWDGADAWQGKDYMHVNVELLDWSMTATSSASRELVSLGDNPDIIVLQTKAKEGPDADLLPYRVIVHLGDRTLFSLADLQVPLAGQVQLDYTDRSAMHGTLTLRRGGRVPIFGKIFRVVDGRMRLDPREPSNPALDIRLTGRTSDDQPIDLTIGGTLKEPFTQPGPGELQALLGGGAATVLGSGVQALGVNQLLGSSVQLRVDSDEEQDDATNYSASVQIDEHLWFEANYRGQQDLNQDESEVVSGTLEYRFKENWSWRTKVGNTGGSVDLLWQHRY
jgi:hypothetical protein